MSRLIFCCSSLWREVEILFGLDFVLLDFCGFIAVMLLDIGCLIVCGDVSVRSEFGFDLTSFCLIFVIFCALVAAVDAWIGRGQGFDLLDYCCGGCGCGGEQSFDLLDCCCCRDCCGWYLSGVTCWLRSEFGFDLT